MCCMQGRACPTTPIKDRLLAAALHNLKGRVQPLGFPIQYSGHLGFSIQCSGLLGCMVVMSPVIHLTSGTVLQGLVVLHKVEVVEISFNRGASWLQGGAPSHNVFAICTQDSTISLRPYCLICYTIMTSAYCPYAILHPQFKSRSAQFSNGATWLPNLYSIGIKSLVAAITLQTRPITGESIAWKISTISTAVLVTGYG